MYRMNLTDYLFTILVILALAFTISYAMQRFIGEVSDETAGKIERQTEY